MLLLGTRCRSRTLPYVIVAYGFPPRDRSSSPARRRPVCRVPAALANRCVFITTRDPVRPPAVNAPFHAGPSSSAPNPQFSGFNCFRPFVGSRANPSRGSHRTSSTAFRRHHGNCRSASLHDASACPPSATLRRVRTCHPWRVIVSVSLAIWSLSTKVPLSHTSSMRTVVSPSFRDNRSNTCTLSHLLSTSAYQVVHALIIVYYCLSAYPTCNVYLYYSYYYSILFYCSSSSSTYVLYSYFLILFCRSICDRALFKLPTLECKTYCIAE